MKNLIVTRHPALVQYLDEVYGIKGEILPHADIDSIRGNKVYGVLPTNMASHCEDFTEVILDIPAHMRGKELTIEQVREYARGLATYKVEMINFIPAP